MKVELSPPGEFVAEEMTAQGYDVARLARKSELSIEDLQAVISGEKQIDADIARKLGNAFNTTADLWRTLQENYNEWGQIRRSRVKQ